MKIIIIVSRSQFVNAWVDCNRLFEATPVPVFNSGILPLNRNIQQRRYVYEFKNQDVHCKPPGY